MCSIFGTHVITGTIPTAFGQQDGRVIFDRFDKNKDGKLERDELPARIRGNFDKVDVNGDGSISLDEHRGYVQQNGGPPQPRPGGIPADPAANVQVERDVAYAATDHPRQRLDLFVPKVPKSEKLPLIVFIHGGAWRSGDKLAGGQQVLRYVQTGEYAGASIGYRLSGDAIWPAQIHDCKAAIRWLKAHSAENGIDPERIGVMGVSAGGHLVAMLGTSGKVAGLEGDLGEHDLVDSRITCVVDFFGPSDLLTMGDFPSSLDHNSAESPESKLIGGTLPQNKEQAKAASPLTYVTADDPPFLIVHGTEDPLVPYDQSVQLDRALREAGAKSLLLQISGGGHGGFGVAEIDDRVKAFFERHLLGREVEISDKAIQVERRNPLPN